MEAMADRWRLSVVEAASAVRALVLVAGGSFLALHPRRIVVPHAGSVETTGNGTTVDLSPGAARVYGLGAPALGAGIGTLALWRLRRDRG